jgi:hypothetical protein
MVDRVIMVDGTGAGIIIGKVQKRKWSCSVSCRAGFFKRLLILQRSGERSAQLRM